jgi:hypothetical protein
MRTEEVVQIETDRIGDRSLSTRSGERIEENEIL